jgi:uncharacterized protein with ATP-grasp and redox domains
MEFECIPCFLRQALQAGRFATDDTQIHQQILKEVMKTLLASDWDVNTSTMGNQVENIVKILTNDPDPYYKVRQRYNKVAMDMYPSLKQLVDDAADPLYTAVKLAIAGNIIDFGVNETFHIEDTIKTVLKTPFAIDDYEFFRKELTTAHTLVYLADNSGEIVFDKLLLETILKIGNIQRITFVIKGIPFLNDAMLEDAQDIGLDEIPQIRFFHVGVGFPETGSGKTSPSFLTMLKRSDMVISKGQANFEDLCTQDYISFLLMVKCPVVAKHLNVPTGSPVLHGPHHLFSRYHISTSDLNLMKG